MSLPANIYRKCAIRTQAAWDAMTTIEQAEYDAHYTDLDLWSAGEALLVIIPRTVSK